MSNKFHNSKLNPSATSYTPSASQQRMLSQQNVQVGDSYAIKGDSLLLAEMEETVQGAIEKKIRTATEQAQAMIEKAKQQADQIVSLAKQQAQSTATQTVAQAEAERDQVCEQAHKEGFEAGFEQGFNEATGLVEEKACTLLETAQTILQGAYEAEKAVLENFQDDALALISHISKHVLQTELQSQPEQLVSMITNAIDSLYLTGRVKVVLGRLFLEQLRQFSPKSEAAIAAMKRFEWVGDPTMTQYEIHILASEGAFSIGPDSQIDQLLEPIAGQLNLQQVLPQADSIASTLKASTFDSSSSNASSLNQEIGSVSDLDLLSTNDELPSAELPLSSQANFLIEKREDDTRAEASILDADLPAVPARQTAPDSQSDPEPDLTRSKLDVPVEKKPVAWELADFDSVLETHGSDLEQTVSLPVKDESF